MGVEDVEAKGVSGVEAVREVGARGDDVAGDEEFGLCEAGDAAAEFVGGEDAEAEEVADDADADDGVAFGAVRRPRRARLVPVAFTKRTLFRLVRPET